MVANIDRSQLLSLIDEGAVVIDVLPRAEYESAHIPGAISIPLRTLNADAAATLVRTKPVVVY